MWHRSFLLSLLSLMCLSACGMIPISKENLTEGEKLVVEVQGYAFYEKVVIDENKEGAERFQIDHSSNVRKDNFAMETIAKLEESFPLALQERGIVVQKGAPIKVLVGISRGESGTVVIVLGSISLHGDDKEYEVGRSLGWADPAGSLFSPTGSRNLRAIKFAAGKLCDVLANALVVLLREKGELAKK